MSELSLRWLGRRDYEQVHSEQLAQRARRIRGEVGDELWLLEHHSVVTTGRRKPESVPTGAWLARTGTQLVHTERGGLTTWHGPGQLVGYAIVDIASQKISVRRFVCALENGLIRWLGDHGVQAGRRDGARGVWIGDDKVAALGIHVSHGVTLHGFALNLTNSLEAFTAFVPCGLVDVGVTSVEQSGGGYHPPQTVAMAVGQAIRAAIVAEAC